MRLGQGRPLHRRDGKTFDICPDGRRVRTNYFPGRPQNGGRCREREKENTDRKMKTRDLTGSQATIFGKGMELLVCLLPVDPPIIPPLAHAHCTCANGLPVAPCV